MYIIYHTLAPSPKKSILSAPLRKMISQSENISTWAAQVNESLKMVVKKHCLHMDEGSVNLKSQSEARIPVLGENVEIFQRK